MVHKLALRYCCGNKTAHEELTDFGILALYQFLAEREGELSEELFETKQFSIAVHNFLWSKIGYEAERLSHSSAVFSAFSIKKRDKARKAKHEVEFFGSIKQDAECCEESAGEFFHTDVADEEYETKLHTIDLMYDVRR